MVNDIFGGNRVEQPHIVSIIPAQYQWQQDTHIYIYICIHPSIESQQTATRCPVFIIFEQHKWTNDTASPNHMVKRYCWSTNCSKEDAWLLCFIHVVGSIFWNKSPCHPQENEKMSMLQNPRNFPYIPIWSYVSRWILRFQSFFFDVCWLNPVDLEESPCLYVWCWQIPSLEKLLSTNLVRSWWMLDRFHKFNHLENHYA